MKHIVHSKRKSVITIFFTILHACFRVVVGTTYSCMHEAGRIQYLAEICGAESIAPQLQSF